MHPSSHRNNHAYSHHTQNIVLDRFAFSQPNVNTFSKTVHFGRSGSRTAPRTTAHTFSKFLLTSIANSNPHSMKLKIPKILSSSNPNHANLTIKSIPSTLYDDPAFSPDPLSHPFFATSHNPVWAPPPATIVGNIPSSHPLTSVAPNFNVIDVVKVSSSVASNTQPLPRETPSTFRNSQLPPIISPPESKAFLASPPPASLSTSSRQSSNPPPKSIEVLDPFLSKKKKKNTTMFWRKSDNTTQSTITEQLVDKRQESPPSYDVIYSDRPTHLRGSSTQDISQPDRPDRPALAPRQGIATVDGRLLLPTNPKRNVDNHPIHPRVLDRIDELDETNPLGVPIHHGGPYEAIQKVVQSTVPHVGNKHQDQSRGPMISRGILNSHTSSGPPPISVSLNLTPGQVLPHNFQEYYNPRSDIASVASHHQYNSLPQQTQNGQTSKVASKSSNRHLSLPVNVPPAEESQQWQKHNVPYRQSSFFNSASSEQSRSGPAETGAGTPMVPNSQYPVQPYTRTQQSDFNSNSPHGKIHDILLDDNRTTQRPMGLTQQRSDSNSYIPDVIRSAQPTSASIFPDEESGDPKLKSDSTVPEQPSRIVTIVNETGSNLPKHTPQQESRFHEIRSVQKTNSSTTGSIRPQQGGRAIIPRHLPKRLIMPAPLQPSRLNAPRGEQIRYPPHNQRPVQAQQIYSRPPSPPSAVPPVSASHGDQKSIRAQEIPMSQGRKLKKRSILGVTSIPPPLAPHIPLSFEPTIASVDPPHNITSSQYKPDKVQKKLLSKRRVDL